MTDNADVENRWYWDHRNRKAYYPRQSDENTVEFVTVWHEEEIEDALANGVVEPVTEIGLDRTDTTFDLIDSFRFPEQTDDNPTDEKEER